MSKLLEDFKNQIEKRIIEIHNENNWLSNPENIRNKLYENTQELEELNETQRELDSVLPEINTETSEPPRPHTPQPTSQQPSLTGKIPTPKPKKGLLDQFKKKTKE